MIKETVVCRRQQRRDDIDGQSGLRKAGLFRAWRHRTRHLSIATAMETPQDKKADAPLVYTIPPYFDEKSWTPKWLQAVVRDLFAFVTIHYNFWPLPAGLFVYYMHKVRS